MTEYFLDATGVARQGDIVLCALSRVVAEDEYSPPQWAPIDQYGVSVNEAPYEAGRPIYLFAGHGLAMVISHDCHMDKEWNRRVRQLLKDGLSQQEAEEQADNDPLLDRNFTVSPLVAVADLPADPNMLRKGNVLGYFPVPAHPAGLIPEASVVDLSYRCTIDRYDTVPVTAISDSERTRLRYALMQFETLRSREVGFEIEQVVGRTIADVQVDQPAGLDVRIELDDGQVLELVQRPTQPDDTAPQRGNTFYHR